MKVFCGNRRRAKRGDLVIIDVAKSPSQSNVELTVWSRIGKHEFSPHVQDISEILIDGRPIIYSPMAVRLHQAKPKTRIEFTAQEDAEFAVMQRVDSKNDPKSRVRISKHGKIILAIKRMVHNAKRALRGKEHPHFSKQ